MGRTRLHKIGLLQGLFMFSLNAFQVPKFLIHVDLPSYPGNKKSACLALRFDLPLHKTFNINWA